MTKPDQVYKTTIATTPEKLWQAIINPEFTKQYWFGNANISTWEKGAKWEHRGMDSGTLFHDGVVEDIVPNKRLVLSWGNPGDAKDVSTATFDIKKVGDTVELTITHGNFIEGSVMASRVAGGWPKVVAAMKEYLETGKAVDITHADKCA